MVGPRRNLSGQCIDIAAIQVSVSVDVTGYYDLFVINFGVYSF
jgi:hypothetical protein